MATRRINIKHERSEILGRTVWSTRRHGWTHENKKTLLACSDANDTHSCENLCSSYKRKMCEAAGTCIYAFNELDLGYDRSKRRYKSCRYYEVTVCTFVRGPEKRDSNWTPKRKEAEGP